MKQYAIRFVNLLAGNILFALGIVLTLRANIGYAPWDVLHAGLSQKTGLSFGLISIIVGLLINVIVLILGEKIGLGTLSNMVLVGLFIDAILTLNIIPLPTQLPFNILMLIGGLFVISLGSYYYIKSAFCAGPRDSLMVALVRKTRLPIGICRSLVELTAFIGGWLLGGMVGAGTVISVIGIGFCIQVTFMLLRFDPTKVKHETFLDTFFKGKK